MEKVKKGYTKEDLKSCLLKMGLTGKEAIMVHSSMKSIGQVDGGADTVVDTRKIFEVCQTLFSIDPDCVICREEIPMQWWQ